MNILEKWNPTLNFLNFYTLCHIFAFRIISEKSIRNAIMQSKRIGKPTKHRAKKYYHLQESHLSYLYWHYVISVFFLLINVMSFI